MRDVLRRYGHIGLIVITCVVTCSGCITSRTERPRYPGPYNISFQAGANPKLGDSHYLVASDTRSGYTVIIELDGKDFSRKSQKEIHPFQ